jgi:F1F0 ATPase subunit 2
MTDFSPLFMAFFAGLFLGAFFFGGLWWTVQKGLKSQNPAVWFFASLILRTSLTLAGFYYISQGDFSRLFACVAGFLLGRFVIVNRLTRDPVELQSPDETEADVAHQS